MLINIEAFVLSINRLKHYTYIIINIKTTHRPMLKLSLALTLLLASSGNLASAKKRILLKGGDRFLQDTPPPGTPTLAPSTPPTTANTT